jgi:drug/metabolite transporter (DMT)-like permease
MKHPMTDQQKAYIYAGLTVLIWSTVASAFKISLRYLTPLQLLLWADIFSVVCLLLILIFQKKLLLLFRYSQKDLIRAGMLGVLNPFLYYVVLFAAYDLLPAQEAQPLNYTWAITLSLFSVPLLRQRLRWLDAAAIAISYFGVLVISTRGNPFSLQFSSAAGVALALGSTVIWSLYWIYNTKDPNDPVAGLFLNFALAFPFILCACCFFSDPLPDSWKGFGGALYVGFFEMGISFVLWLSAMKLTLSAARISTLIFFSPFLSLVFINFFVGETIRMSTITGLIFIVAGNGLQQMRGSSKRKARS